MYQVTKFCTRLVLINLVERNLNFGRQVDPCVDAGGSVKLVRFTVQIGFERTVDH